jgi:hypothetical protein
MGRPFTFMTCFFSLFISLVFNPPLSAKALKPPSVVNQQQEEKEKNKKKQDQKETDKKQTDKKETAQKGDPAKTDIKEVPKSRKHSRPTVVSKPGVKVKPIKIVRPKIKKP